MTLTTPGSHTNGSANGNGNGRQRGGPRPVPAAPSPAAAHRGRHPLLGSVADWLTLAGVFLSPLTLIALGTFPVSDLLLGLVMMARGVQLAGSGIDFDEVRRHTFLLTILGLLSFFGFITGLAIGEPVSWDLFRMIIATFGSIVVIATFPSGNGGWQRLVKAYALGAVALATSSFVMGAAEASGRARGLTYHPNLLGHSAIMGTFCCIYFFERARSRRIQAAWAFAVLLELGSLLRSGSRGSLIGLAVGGLLYLCLTKDRRYVLAALAAAYLGVMTLSSGIVTLPPSNPITRLVNPDERTEGSNKQREEVLDIGVSEIRDHPVFGSGYAIVILIHVVYLQAWIGAGFVGGFLIMFLGICMVLWPLGQRRSGLALSCALTGIAVAWLFTNILGVRDQWLFIAIAVRATASPLHVVLRHRRDEMGPKPGPRPAPQRALST